MGRWGDRTMRSSECACLRGAASAKAGIAEYGKRWRDGEIGRWGDKKWKRN